MKKMINNLSCFLLVFISIFTSCSSDTTQLSKTVSYKGVELMLPADWVSESEDIEPNLAYQISCKSNDGENAIIIALVDFDLELEVYMATMKTEYRVDPFYSNTEFGNTTEYSFQERKCLISQFIGSHLGSDFKGEIFVFKSNGKTFLIQTIGDYEFYDSQLKPAILASIKIDSPMQESNMANSPNDEINDWADYNITNVCTISIPPTLELRNDDSYVAKLMDDYREGEKKNFEIDIQESNAVFQPVGLNENIEGANSKYARILIKLQVGQPDDYFKSSEQIDFTKEQEDELNEYFYNEFVKTISITSMKLIEWFPVEFSSINGQLYQKVSYTRQMGDEPIVAVQEYTFHNYDEAVSLTLSYRVNESDIWKNDFEQIIKSFTHTN